MSGGIQTKDFPHVVILPAPVQYIRKEEMCAFVLLYDCHT